ncbi:MAG: cysteine desulfurase [Myxococcaceae bacterium]|nr:cysteine desulfurase [Myxococcaceae bacterium]MCA3012477.1 cysteine desulfurase [Myxococcaceae bacterium]
MIYLDHNAGAPLRPQVAGHLARALTETAGNPSSVHRVGREARKRLDAAREAVARAFGAQSPREVIFTGSGSEAAALAIIGAFLARPDADRRTVVTSAIEHPCVLGAVAQLERLGATVVRVPPRADGQVDAAEVVAHLGPAVALCSLMWVNNETGVIQPVDIVARACVERGIPFHTDAVQALGRVPATLREVPADLLSFSAHKLGGPAGVGVLINRRQVDVAALVPGHQENGRRGGTQSVALAEALVLALEATLAEQATAVPRLAALRDELERRVLAALPSARVTGAGAPRVANTTNLCVPGADGEGLLIALDLEGICVSTGAACASGSLTPSHVLRAMGLSPTEAQASLRLSLGASTTPGDVERVAAALARLVPLNLGAG